MSCSLSQKRTEDLFVDYPKLVKQVQNQKFFLATGTRPFKIHETKFLQQLSSPAQWRINRYPSLGSMSCHLLQSPLA